MLSSEGNGTGTTIQEIPHSNVLASQPLETVQKDSFATTWGI